MRNLKKLLSMLLVVAMIVSLCAVGSFSAAAAEYSETTNYKEAAAVVSGIGIINGYEDGTMQYDKAVTREEAAKIVCVALVGADTVANLKTAAAPFDDVAANRWSAPYIAYLKSLNIINGKTASEFDPTAEVTGVEFAKMLLCAAGYGKAGEFVGASWDVNTITAANTNGIFENTKTLDLTAAATREECMLYAFNTIVGVPVVNYNTTFGTYYVGASLMDGMSQATEHDTLAWKNFKLEYVNGDPDAFGRPARSWKANGKTIAESAAVAAPDAVLTGMVTSASICAVLDKSVVKELNKNIAEQATAKTAMDAAEAIMNDAEDDMDDAKEAWDADTSDADLEAAYNSAKANYEAKKAVYGNAKVAYDAVADYAIYVDGVPGAALVELKANEIGSNVIAGAGATTEIYVQDDYVTFVVTYEHAAEVTKVDTAKNELTLRDVATAATVTVKGENVSIAGFAKKDIVLYTLGNDDVVVSLAKANSFTGTYTSKAGFFYVIDGNNYGFSTKAKAVGGLTMGTSYTFYTDSQGAIINYVVYDDSAVASTAQYLYVVDEWANAEDRGLQAEYGVSVVYANGGKATLYLPINPGNYITYNGVNYSITADDTVKNLSTSATINLSTGKLFKNGFYAYSINDAGYVTLRPVTGNFVKVGYQTANAPSPATTIGNVQIKTGSYSIGNVTGKAGSKTVLTIVDEKGLASTYTGNTTFPTTTGGGVVADVLYTFDANNNLKTVFVYVGGATGYTAKAPTYAYAVNCKSESLLGDVWNVWVDGAMQEITIQKDKIDAFSNPISAEAGKVYELNCAAGIYTLTDIDAAVFDVDDDTVTTAGSVNAGYVFALAAGSDKGAYGAFNSATYTYDYYEWATVAALEDNFFTTVAATAEDSSINAPIDSHAYYFDKNTKVYDVVNGGTTELAEGDVFVALVDGDASTLYADENYVTNVWVVNRPVAVQG